MRAPPPVPSQRARPPAEGREAAAPAAKAGAATTPPRAVPLRTAGVLGLLASLGALAALLAALVVGQKSVRTAVEAAERSAEVRLNVRALLSTLIDAETGQRGYLLTGDPKFLEPYERAERSLPALMATLRRLTSDDARQRRRLEAIDRLAGERLGMLDETIGLRRAGAGEDAASIGRAERGKAKMDHLRDEIATMEADEARALEARQARARGVGRLMTGLSIVSTGALAATVVSILALRRDAERKRRADEALARAAGRLATLHAIDRAILRAESPRQIAAAAAERLAEAVGARYVSVVGYDEGFRRGEFLALAGDVDVPSRAGDSHEPPRWFIEKVAPAAAPLVWDLRDPDTEHPYKRPLLEAGLGAVVTAPLASDGELLGVLNLAVPSPAEAGDVGDVLVEVAAQVAVALKQGRLRDDLRRHADELERRVESRTAALTEANRELEAFSYSVSHDLRAPLRGMQGYALALVEDYGPRLDDVGRGYTNKIVVATARMEGLIQDLLSYGRLGREHIALQPTGLRAAVDEALQQVAADARAARASFDVGACALDVVAHRPTLVLCVQNYLTNALKFVPPGRAPAVRVRAEAVGDAGRLWVEDEGLGVLPEHRGRIFDVFERLHSADKYPGTGIGLAIVKRGVERMGGRVGVESAPGAGSRFWLELPLAKGNP